jgi:lysozyme
MLEGIDISHWETANDWNAVKASGVRFVYLKATQGEKSVDRCFHKYRLACQTVGLPWGAYHFYDFRLYADSQAKHFINTVGRSSTETRGMLPPVIDLEPFTIWQDGERKQAEFPRRLPLLNSLQTLLEALKKAYGSALLYTNPAMLKRLVPLPDWLLATPLWIAHYTPACQPWIAPFKNWLFWQYSDAGEVPGIHGAVDKDRFNGDEEDLVGWVDLPGAAIPPVNRTSARFSGVCRDSSGAVSFSELLRGTPCLQGTGARRAGLRQHCGL